jgi:hypothetical protein
LVTAFFVTAFFFTARRISAPHFSEILLYKICTVHG